MVVVVESNDLARYTFFTCCSSKTVAAVLCLIVLSNLRKERRRAMAGAPARPLLILPVYEPILIALMPALLIEILVFYETVYGEHFWAYCLGWCWFSWIREGLSFTLMDQSASRRAFLRAARRSAIVPLATLPCCLLYIWSPLASSFMVHVPAISLYVLSLGGYIYSRPALRPYARYMLAYRLTWILYGCANLSSSASVSDPAIAMLLAVVALLEIPWMLVVYWALLSDTLFWRGYRAPQSIQKLHLPGIGGGGASDSVLSTGLQQLLEQNRDELLDFSYLELSDIKLGGGGSANVYKATYRREARAVKIFTPMELTMADVAVYSEETAIAASLRHPNVVVFYGVCVVPPVVALVFELCECGSLFDVLQRQTLSRPQQLQVAQQCAESLAYLHSRGLIHRDLKSMNFLVSSVDPDICVKLTDFGLARMLPMGDDASVLAVLPDEVEAASIDHPRAQLLTTGIGTLNWMSPELLRGSLYTEKADIWSLGCVFFEAVTGDVPFAGVGRGEPNVAAALYRVVVTEDQRPPFPEDSPIAPLVQRMWAARPEDRPRIEEVVSELRMVAAGGS